MDAGSERTDAGVDAGTDDGDAGWDASAPEDGDVIPKPCMAGEITVVETCTPPFQPCGGSIAEGGYCYTGVCIDRSELLEIFGPCAPQVTIEEATGTITGRVSFLRDARVHREAVTHVEAVMRTPNECALPTCALFGTIIGSALPGASATCTNSGSEDCLCEVTLDADVDSIEPYVADETHGILTIGEGAERRTYEYCAETESLRLLETTGPGDEPGIQTLAPAH